MSTLLRLLLILSFVALGLGLAVAVITTDFSAASSALTQLAQRTTPEQNPTPPAVETPKPLEHDKQDNPAGLLTLPSDLQWPADSRGSLRGAPNNPLRVAPAQLAIDPFADALPSEPPAESELPSQTPIDDGWRAVDAHVSDGPADTAQPSNVVAAPQAAPATSARLKPLNADSPPPANPAPTTTGQTLATSPVANNPPAVRPTTATATPAQPVAARLPSPSGEGDGKLDINIPDTDIREVLELLSRSGNLNILASKSVTGTVKASLTGVDIDTALKAILRSTGYQARREGDFVYVGTPEDFKVMDRSVDRIGTRVYRPNYVTAAELQTLVTPMLTPTVGTVSVSSAADVGIASDADASGGNNFAGADVVLVRDFEAVLAQVDQVFEEVDRQPLQVSIEAMILSVSLSDETKIGVDWELLRNKQHLRVVFGSPLATAVDDMDISNNGGLRVGFLDSSLAAFLEALETVGETHVISSPRLMCLNKQRAEIHIGEERGYVSTTVTETAATQSVEFLEVGTQLRLRPFISNDGLIRLEIHPELSTGTVEVSENFTLPNKAVTQVTSNVMVRDGATLVIGGLLREDLESNSTQIPLLGSLPYIGPLFRHQTDKTSRDEIIVLITPRIVWEPKFNCEGEYADCEFHMQHGVMADKMSHVSRVYYGRRYKRMAKAAWVAGDAHAALRYANMSIQFNRLDREAIQLRTQIVANSPYGDKAVDWHLKEGLIPWTDPIAGKKQSNWVLDELHGPHTHLGQEPAPIYPQGQSGERSDLVIPEIVVPPEVIEAPEGEVLPDAQPPQGFVDPQELVVPEESP